MVACGNWGDAGVTDPPLSRGKGDEPQRIVLPKNVGKTIRYLADIDLDALQRTVEQELQWRRGEKGELADAPAREPPTGGSRAETGEKQERSILPLGKASLIVRTNLRTSHPRWQTCSTRCARGSSFVIGRDARQVDDARWRAAIETVTSSTTPWSGMMKARYPIAQTSGCSGPRPMLQRPWWSETAERHEYTELTLLDVGPRLALFDERHRLGTNAEVCSENAVALV